MILQKECKLCKEFFLRTTKYSYKQWENRIYCSHKCSMKVRAREKVKDPAYRAFLRSLAVGRKQSEETKIKRGIYKKGAERPNWKGGVSFDGLYLRLHTKKRLHRHVIEQHIGRELLKTEHVHHINGNKLDNSINNLQIISPSEHTRLHHSGLKFPNGYKKKCKKD